MKYLCSPYWISPSLPIYLSRSRSLPLYPTPSQTLSLSITFPYFLTHSIYLFLSLAFHPNLWPYIQYNITSTFSYMDSFFFRHVITTTSFWFILLQYRGILFCNGSIIIVKKPRQISNEGFFITLFH